KGAGGGRILAQAWRPAGYGYRAWKPNDNPEDARMRICLFEDHGVIDLEPLALTRPVFDLLCGLSSLSAKQARYFAPCSVAVMVRPFLAELTAERRPDLRVN